LGFSGHVNNDNLNKTTTMITNARLHMFVTDSKLSYSAWGMTESEAAASIRRAYPSVGRLVYLGCQ